LAPGSLQPGPHRLELEVADEAGNREVVAWTVEVQAESDSPAEGGTSRWGRSPSRVELPPTLDGRRRWLTPFLLLEEDGEGGWRIWPATQLPDVSSAPAGPGPRQVDPRPSGRLLSPASGEPVFRPAALWTIPDSLSADEELWLDQVQGLQSAGRTVRYVAGDWPTYGWISVSWSGVGEGLAADSTVAIYRQTPQGEWRFAARPDVETSPAPNSLDSWHWPLEVPGRYAALFDREPPRLGDGRSQIPVAASRDSAQAGVTPPRWEKIVVPMHDRGAGIDPQTCRAQCDGRILYPEPDLPRKRLLVELPDSLAAGSYRLSLEVADRIGHRAAIDLRLQLQERP
jgi:hypothetical protein